MKSRNDFLHFDSVMNDLEKRIIEPNLVLYNIIIQCYEQQGRREDAMSYFLEVVKEGFVPERATFKALLWVPEKVSNVQQMLTVFLSVKDILSGSGMEAAAEELRDTISESFSRILCVGLIEGKRPDYILRLFEMAEASTLELSVSHYDDILWSCGFRTGDSAVAKYVLKKRWKMDPPLDVQLCNHVMQVMGKQKKWWAALEVFEQMNEEGPPPDARSYSIIRGHFNFLLKASKDRGTCRWNVQLLEKMEAHGIAPDQTAWDTTLVACAIKVDPELAVYVFDKMIEKGHQPNVLSYGALLSTLEKGGLYAKADEVWKHMRKMGVRPNINAYTIMISVYGNSKNYEELRLLIDQMSAAKVEPTLVTYNALITVCAKSNDGQAALEWMQSLIHSGLIPDSISYSQLIIALSRSDNVEAAKDALFEARRLGLTVSPVALDCLVNACRRSNVKQPLEEFNPEAEML
ncbi:hypothetical protein KP509_23G070300 [Ceratopteris richardii]|nr:hypothetical protein KP509_23G070300 [Ceratopteris richardii]